MNFVSRFFWGLTCIVWGGVTWLDLTQRPIPGLDLTPRGLTRSSPPPLPGSCKTLFPIGLQPAAWARVEPRADGQQRLDWGRRSLRCKAESSSQKRRITEAERLEVRSRWPRCFGLERSFEPSQSPSRRRHVGGRGILGTSLAWN